MLIQVLLNNHFPTIGAHLLRVDCGTHLLCILRIVRVVLELGLLGKEDAKELLKILDVRTQSLFKIEDFFIENYGKEDTSSNMNNPLLEKRESDIDFTPTEFSPMVEQAPPDNPYSDSMHQNFINFRIEVSKILTQLIV